jgi:hypothetical protein
MERQSIRMLKCVGDNVLEKSSKLDEANARYDHLLHQKSSSTGRDLECRHGAHSLTTSAS